MKLPRLRRISPWIQVFVTAVGIACWCAPMFAAPRPGVVVPAKAMGASRVTFADSLGTLSTPLAATLHPMTAAHLSDAVSFNIPLTLRHQAELEARVAQGEILSGEELRAKYFPQQSDYDLVANWLKSEGFTVDEIGDAHLAVFAHGTVAQIQSSFQIDTALITAKGADYAVAQSAPSLPAAIAAPALGVSGLSYRRPQNRLVHPTVGAAGQPNAVPSGGYKINDIAKIYGGYGLSVNGTALTGAGQTIAIESYTTLGTSDYTTFWANNGVARTGTLTLINSGTTTIQTPTQNPGNAEEAALDIEWAGGIARGANLRVYATTYDNNDAPERNYNKAISDGAAAGNPIRQFSSSYGPEESELTSTELSAYNQIFLSMTAEGMTYINATGDVGSSPVEAYGVFPYVLGVGGTTLNITTATSDVRSTETGWSGSSGGKSTKFGKPTWQVGNGIGTGSATGTMRLFPDIALAADPDTGAYYVFEGTVDDGQNNPLGGTSWSAPTFAGFLALIHQGRALNTPVRGPLGFLNPRLYPLIGTTNFYDVTSGNNGGYNAAVSYDLVTGIGVPTISNLLTTLLGPTITSFSPTSGNTGTSVIIRGTNFYANTGYPVGVTFNGTAAASVTVNSAIQITAVAPSGVTAGPIVVTSFGDSATSATNFTLPAPDAQITTANPGTVKQGDNGDPFTLSVTNAGTQAINGTTMVTVYPGNGLYLAALSGTGWNCTANADGSGNWTCTYAGSVAAGSGFPALTASVNVSPSAPTTVQNGSLTGHVTAPNDANSGNDTSTVTFTIAAATTTPTQQWRYQYFHTTANSGNAADTANPAGDGISNLTKYALGLNPTVPTVIPLTESVSSGYLQLTVPKNPNATDITYIVQVNGDLANPTGWTASGTTVDQNTSSLLQVHASTPVSGAARQFLRLQISR